MVKLIKIFMSEKNDSMVRSLQRALLKDQKDKDLHTNPTPKHLALQKRVHELETDSSKRRRAAALEEYTILKETEDAKVAAADIDLKKTEARIKLQALNIKKHRSTKRSSLNNAVWPSTRHGCRKSMLACSSTSAVLTTRGWEVSVVKILPCA